MDTQTSIAKHFRWIWTKIVEQVSIYLHSARVSVSVLCPGRYRGKLTDYMVRGHAKGFIVDLVCSSLKHCAW